MKHNEIAKEKEALSVVMLSTDRNVFTEGSAVQKRMLEYSALFKELHIIVFNIRTKKIPIQKISSKVWIHPTNSKSRFLYIFDALRLSRKLKSYFKDRNHNPTQLLIVTAQDPFETGLAGFFISRSLSAKLQLQIHTDFLNQYFKRESKLNTLRILIAKFLLPKADGIRVVSNRIYNSLVEKLSVPKEKITLLPIYVDGELIRNAEVTVDLKRKYSQFRFIVLMASRLTAEKNIPIAFAALAEVIKKYPLTGLIIVGEGKMQDSLKAEVFEKNLDGNIIFEPWRQDILSYMKTANAFLLTSSYEGYGMTLVEAGFSGCPIISSNVGIAGDVLVSGKDALICSVGDKDCYLGAIIRLIEDNALRESLKREATKHLEDHVGTKHSFLIRYRKALEMCFPKAHFSE